MIASRISTRLHRLFGLYLLAIAAVTVVYGWHNARAANDWAIGEWLINYSGGFVRRGLIGQIILAASHLLRLSPILLALAVQLLVFATLFVNAFRLTRGVRWSLPLVAILLSPATFAFHVLDPPAGFRKEILLFAGLSILAVTLVRGRGKPWQIALLLLVLTQVTVLSHEPLVLYLPYLFGAVFLSVPSFRRAFTICILPALLALVSVLAAARHPGNAATAAQICSSVGGSLGAQNQGVCGGAILYLTRSLDYARQDTLEYIHTGHYLILYPITAALTLLPFVLLVFQLRRSAGTRALTNRSLIILAITFALAVVASLPLFVIAMDWGRWIYIHAVCLTLLVLLFDRAPLSPRTAPLIQSAPTTDRITPRFVVGALLVALYATAWTLPHVSIFPGRFGYLDLVRYLHNYSHVSHSVS